MKTIISLVILCLMLLGCGSALNAVRPEQQKLDHRSLNQSGEQLCVNTQDEAEVLVVDFPSSQRGNLEVMIRENVVAVRYDCKSLKVLRACKIDGSYAYKGTLIKEELLRLESADEINANLPFTGTSIASKIGGGMSRGATLDLSITSVGQQRTARYEVTRDDLEGRCKGATHFIYSAHVGAFAMVQGEKAGANLAAEAMGVGANAKSINKRAFFNKDGDISACKRTSSNAKQPQRGCGAILKLYLIPISESAQVASKSTRNDRSEKMVRVPTCPRGMMYISGKCTRAVKDVCTPQEITGCKALCSRRDASSCRRLGFAFQTGRKVSKDIKSAIKLYEKACDLSDANSCHRLGQIYKSGTGVRKQIITAYKRFLRGCQLGFGKSCFSLAVGLMRGQGIPKDERAGFVAYEEGCAAGDAPSCTNLGKAYSKGAGVKRDIYKSFKLYKRACDGGSSTACYNVGSRYSRGKGVQKSMALRLKYYKKACKMGHNKACRFASKKAQ